MKLCARARWSSGGCDKTETANCPRFLQRTPVRNQCCTVASLEDRKIIALLDVYRWRPFNESHPAFGELSESLLSDSFH